jgi:hypothetical protein
MTRIDKLYERQGMGAPQSDEDWVAYAEQKLARRKRNVANAREVLERNQIQYDELEPELFIIHQPHGFVEYFPATGTWRVMSKTTIIHTGFGVRNLVKHLKGIVL